MSLSFRSRISTFLPFPDGEKKSCWLSSSSKDFVLDATEHEPHRINLNAPRGERFENKVVQERSNEREKEAASTEATAAAAAFFFFFSDALLFFFLLVLDALFFLASLAILSSATRKAREVSMLSKRLTGKNILVDNHGVSVFLRRKEKETETKRRRRKKVEEMFFFFSFDVSLPDILTKKLDVKRKKKKKIRVFLLLLWSFHLPLKVSRTFLLLDREKRKKHRAKRKASQHFFAHLKKVQKASAAVFS